MGRLGPAIMRLRESLVGRDWRLLLAGQSLSQFGDWLHRVALLVVAYQITGGIQAPALLLLSQHIARAAILPLGGTLADRLPKRATMIATDVARAVLAASFVLVREAGQFWWLWLATILLQLLAGLFVPAHGAATVAIVGPKRFPAANALGRLAAQTGFLLGPAIGGLLVAYWGTAPVFLINATTFLVSAACLLAMRLPEPPRSSGSERASLLADLREGWDLARHDPVVRLQCASIAASATVAMAVSASLVGLGVSLPGGGAAFVGVALTSVGLGTFAGTAAAGFLGLAERGDRPGVILSLGVALAAVVALLGAVRAVVPLLGLLAVAGALSMIIELVALAVTASRVPARQLGRGFGFVTASQTLGTVAGALAAIGPSAWIGLGPTLLLLGLLVACVLTVTVLVHKRGGAETLPLPDAA